MRKVKCVDCEAFFEGNTREEVMKNMHPHYMDAHKDVMEKGNEEKRKIWMMKFEENWKEAE